MEVVTTLARLREPLSKRCSNRRGSPPWRFSRAVPERSGTGNHEHGECRGRDAQESARYSEKLVDTIGKAITGGSKKTSCVWRP